MPFNILLQSIRFSVATCQIRGEIEIVKNLFLRVIFSKINYFSTVRVLWCNFLRKRYELRVWQFYINDFLAYGLGKT